MWHDCLPKQLAMEIFQASTTLSTCKYHLRSCKNWTCIAVSQIHRHCCKLLRLFRNISELNSIQLPSISEMEIFIQAKQCATYKRHDRLAIEFRSAREKHRLQMLLRTPLNRIILQFPNKWRCSQSSEQFGINSEQHKIYTCASM